MSGIMEDIQVMGNNGIIVHNYGLSHCPFPMHRTTKTKGCPGVHFKSHKIHMCYDQVTLE